MKRSGATDSSGPTSAAHPPVAPSAGEQPPSLARDSTRRRSVSAVPVSSHVGPSSTASGSQPNPQPIQARNPAQAASASSASAASEVPAAGASSAFQQAYNQLQGVVEECMVRDQLELILKIIKNPSLADALHCKVKVKLPNTDRAVQVFPEVSSETPPAHRKRYVELLQQASSHTLKTRQDANPDPMLLNAYVACRARVCEIGEDEATGRGEFFEFMDILRRMLVDQHQKQIQSGGTTFNFTRLPPDRSIDLDPVRQQQECSGVFDPPSTKKRKKTSSPQSPPPQQPPQSALRPASIDLRLQATDEGIRQALGHPSRTDMGEDLVPSTASATVPPPPSSNPPVQ